MITNTPITGDKNAKQNFDTIFTHLNRFYLGSMSIEELSRIDVSQLPYGAMVYDRTNHCLKVLTQNQTQKGWKSANLS